MHWLYVINPGSTSTKTALFQAEQLVSEKIVRHTTADLSLDQRQELVAEDFFSTLKSAGLAKTDLAALVGRGGLLHPLAGGTYLVNEAMLADLRQNRYGKHASNSGALLAAGLAWPLGLPAFVVDPPVVDEMMDLARYTGLPQIWRRSTFHALNQKAVARRTAAQLGLAYEKTSLIVAHLGGGISVAAHQQGQVIDVNDAMEEGPFSPQRAGTMPSSQLLDLVDQLGTKKVRQLLVGQGGLLAHTGTADVKVLAQRPDQARLLAALAYQVAKAMAALTACFAGQPDALILTGGLAYSQLLVDQIKARVEFLGKVFVYPGEMELEALASGALRVLSGQQTALDYQREAAR